MTAAATWTDWSCAVQVHVQEANALHIARRLVEDEMAAVGKAASRFRTDSELTRVNASTGRTQYVSPLLAELIRTALQAAHATGGAVDPTLGSHLVALGYDRDITHVRQCATETAPPRTSATWREIRLDGALLTVPPGLTLDLGATAKAWSADRAANRVAAVTGSPALVSIGGDIAVAGGGDGWSVLVSERSEEADGPTITAYEGGLATSTTLARRWTTSGRTHHHVLHPRTGRPTDGPWRTATVAADSCVSANTASTAALVMGAQAERWLTRHRLPARLIHRDGWTLTTCDWPSDSEIAA